MASKGINKVILVGNLGNDPDVRYTPNGNAVAKISIATSEKWKDKNTGQVNEKTEWHNVVFFGKLAEIAGEYLKKGSQVYVEGKLKTDKYQDKKTGQDRYSTNIVVDSFTGVLQMLGSQDGSGGQNRNNNASGGQNQNQHRQNRPNQNQNYQQNNNGYNQNRQNNQQQNNRTQNNQNNQQQAQQGEFNDNFDDDIPF